MDFRHRGIVGVWQASSGFGAVAMMKFVLRPVFKMT